MNLTYILAQRQGDLFKTMSRISDMVANQNTTAFKAEKNVFGTLLEHTTNTEQVAFSNIETTVRDTRQGAFEVTGRQLDVALQGDGYFMVETPLGLRFTKAGNLERNYLGILTSKNGYPIIGPGGSQIELLEEDIEIEILEDGRVYGNGEERGQIGVFLFENTQLLERVGRGLYKKTVEDQQLAEPIRDFRIAQGMLEKSNVNAIAAMTDLVTITRDIETTKSLSSRYHDLQVNAIRKLTEQ